MRKTSVLAALVLSSLAGVMVACGDDDDFLDPVIFVRSFEADLTAAAEIPSPIGAPTATGTATMTINRGILTVVVTVNGNLTSPVTMAHIHGPAGTTATAPIILDFVPSMTAVIAAGALTGTIVSASFDLNTLPVSSTGVLRVDPVTLIDFMSTGQAYVNVHTTLNPAGEIRGQIVELLR